MKGDSKFAPHRLLEHHGSLQEEGPLYDLCLNQENTIIKELYGLRIRRKE